MSVGRRAGLGGRPSDRSSQACVTFSHCNITLLSTEFTLECNWATKTKQDSNHIKNMSEYKFLILRQAETPHRSPRTYVVCWSQVGHADSWPGKRRLTPREPASPCQAPLTQQQWGCRGAEWDLVWGQTHLCGDVLLRITTLLVK